MEFYLGKSLEAESENPIIIDGVRYRKVRPGSEEDFEKIVRVERAGWEESLAFPEEWMREDFEKFPGLQVLAICEETGRLLGKVSAVRFAGTVDEIDEMVAMDEVNWDEIYENRRDAEGIWCEGSGMVVDRKAWGRGISRNLVPLMGRAIAEVDGIERVTFQSRNIGFGKWMEGQGFDVGHLSVEKKIEEHRKYVRQVLEGTLEDPILSRYASFVRESNGLIQVLNHDAIWHGDIPSLELGMRFEATKLVKKIREALIRV